MPKADHKCKIGMTRSQMEQLEATKRELSCKLDISVDNLFASAFHFASIGMAIVSPSGAWTHVNEALCSLVGYTEDELYEKKFQDITHPDDLNEDLEHVQQMLDGTIKTYQMEKRYFHKQGHVVNVLLSVSLVKRDDGTPGFFISQIQDITRRKQLEAELVRFAMEDTLTEVHNRRYFLEYASREIARGSRFNEPQAILMIDIDHFKQVNDTYGHDIGDEVLKVMARTCRETVRQVDIFARLGGEEFGALLISTDAEMAVQAAERVRRNIQQCVVETAQGAITFTVSIGVAAFIGGISSLENRLKTADTALYKAKAAGRNRVEVISEVLPQAGEQYGLQTSFAHLVWKAEYESGNDKIDSQHRTLFQLANRLLSAVIANLPKQDTGAIAKELLSHVVNHFRDEDAIYRAAGYPLADEHGRIHNSLVQGVKTLLGKFEADKLSVGELFSFLAMDVVSQHMLTEDRRFFPYLHPYDSPAKP